MLLLKRVLVSLLVLAFSLTSLAGCSKPGNSSSSVAASSQEELVVTSRALAGSSSAAQSSVASEPQQDAQETLLLSMQKAAQQGEVINCEFPVKSKTIEDVEKAWGKEDKTEYIASAKGTYATYSKKNIAFGFNKGDQLFEVRSYDSQLKQLTRSKVKEVFGKPAYDVKSGNEEIIGYVATKDFKILLVFPNFKADGESAKLDHYSVFYPQGTVNNMADDPGRQW
jgi:hypothetical protein